MDCEGAYIIDRMMSLAMMLWSREEDIEALAVTLLGVAAASKLHYPKKGDRDAYESYLRDKLTEIISRYLGDVPVPLLESVTIRGQTLESILYKSLRCNIVHELRFPTSIRLAKDEDMSSPIEADEDGTIVFSRRLPLALMFTVVHDADVLQLRIDGKMMLPHGAE